MTEFWIRAELEDAAFRGDELRAMGPAVRGALETACLLRRSEDLRTVECDACGDPHLEEVEILTEPPGSKPRAYIYCPVVGRVAVEPERLKVWRIDLDRLARLAGDAVGLDGRVQTLVEDRVWLLGTRAFVDKTRDVFLVRGVTWPDRLALIEGNARVATSPCPLILCLNRYPDDPEWHRGDRVVMSLAECDWLDRSSMPLLERINAVLRERPRPADRSGCLFHRQEKMWRLSFDGKTVHVGDVVGMGYIAELLRHPRTEIEAAALGVPNQQNAGVRVETDDERITKATASMPGIPMADAKAIKTVKAELAKRQAELTRIAEDSDPSRTRLEDEISKLQHYLSQVEGHRGQARVAGGAAQRSRSRVKHAISRAIDKIAAQHPSLGNHLKDSIRTGTSVIYMPAEVPDWHF